MRLNVFIAKSGCASRRGADELIKQGKVTVNGKKTLEPYYQVSKGDQVKVKGKVISATHLVYLIFNKPKRVTTTRQDKFAKKTVMDYLPARLRHLYPVGRLDRESQGLLILTNDGAFCYRMTHPKFNVEKEYIVVVQGAVTQDVLGKARRGIYCEGDFLRVERLRVEKRLKESTQLCVIIREGKKRHLRRLFWRLGHEVIELKRVRVGSIFLGNLKEGDFREFRPRVKRS